jgi:flagellar motor switch protein FliN
VSWESVAWRPADADILSSATALADLLPLARSAVEEAVSALVMQPVSATSLSVASIAASDLPAGFAPVTSFELLGTPRRGVWAALDPSLGGRLGGGDITVEVLAGSLTEAVDTVLAATVGEGLSATPAEDMALEPTAELTLLRLTLRDGEGSEVAIAVAFLEPVLAELTSHVLALQTLGPGGPAPAVSPVAAQPVEASVAAPAPAAPAPAAASRPEPSVTPYVLSELTPTPVTPAAQNIELLMGVNLHVTVEIGRTRLAIRDVLTLTTGSIVELDKLAGEKVDVLVNGQPIAQGDVVVVDENFGVRITDVVSRQRRILSADGAA